MIKRKDMPEVIYIQREDNSFEYDEIGELTWSDTRINDSDIKYVLDKNEGSE